MNLQSCTRQSILSIFCLTLTSAFTFLPTELASAADRPNVLIILSDDQGYGDVSAHGNPVLKTPNLDRLHAESIRLTDFHVAPMCTPTRGQLMTGRDALHTGASSVCAGRSFLRRGVPTMAEIFAASGYRTGQFGKWHLGDSYPNLPHQRGFQEAVYHLGWGITSMADLWQNDCFDGRFAHNGKLQEYPGYCTDVWFNLAQNYMREQQQKKEPFFVYLPTNAPHGPHWVAEKYKQPYEGRGPAAFFGMIANLDENLGRLDAFLTESGLKNNTIVIYFNDNGGTGGVKLFNAGMRAGKTTYYDGGHRAMCFIRWPAGMLRKPCDLGNLTEVQDLLPTLIDLCSLQAPKAAKFDGTSLAGLLRGTTDKIPERMLVVQYGQRPVKWEAAVLWNRWRLVKENELYDLATDPGQMTNVADEHPDVLRKMREHYESWWAGVLPTLDEFSPISIGADQENPVTLSAADWANVYCDNMNNLRQGLATNGPWTVLVEKDGTYEISLRRWPKEADAAISGGVPEFKAVDGGLPAGKALPIVKARLKIAALDETKPVTTQDKEIKFTVTLKAGTKLPMQSWFYDDQGKELCGAYFAYVERKDSLSFRQHAIDPESAYSAGAAFDVNHDGKLDIVTGGVWYEAPTWKKHTVREVEFIRGRFDDYSCLPLDANNDGWMDFLISNYRSQKLGWIEHPGAKLGPWTEHVVERPGPMETGRLADVDGDGKLDLLPNGRDFAAWWEIIPAKQSGGQPEFVRHDLPKEIVGHGIGWGDINGDGRSDLVGLAGWLEAPEDRRKERWLWHAEFDLDRDASMPIVVTDVDRDGDADIVWGRGHRTGLWWLEQTSHNFGRRSWTPHAIDTSWSQPHTVELGDLDGDGRPEIVAGKRFLGHDGKDPGEWDPLVIYWYRFLPETRTWQRGIISPEGGPAGFDVDPKLVDLDGDGDLDVLTPGRSGLYWFENLRIGGTSAANNVATPAAPPLYSDHNHLLTLRSADGKESTIATPADWGRRRAHIKAHVESVMGPLPDPSRRVPLDTQITSMVNAGNYFRYTISFASEPGDRVPAYLLVPRGLKKPAPAMLCLHQTTKMGKDEPVGLGGSPYLHYAHELAERGYVCIVPDYPSFGEYPYDFRAPKHTLPSGSMKAIWNNLRAIDVLETRPEVDRQKIGVIGHSLGGHNAIFTTLFDQRIRAVVTSCGFTAFPDYYKGNLAGWTSDRYMPRIREVYGNDPARVPFDFTELVGAMAPRPFFSNSPTRDSNFDVDGVRKVIASASEVYRLLEAPDNLHVVYPDAAHSFPDETRKAAYEWLDVNLRGKEKKEK